MADFPSKVTTETSSTPTQSSQQGGNSLRGLTASVTNIMDMSFIRSIPAILMMVEIVCNRYQALLSLLYSTLFRKKKMFMFYFVQSPVCLYYSVSSWLTLTGDILYFSNCQHAMKGPKPTICNHIIRNSLPRLWQSFIYTYMCL